MIFYTLLAFDPYKRAIRVIILLQKHHSNLSAVSERSSVVLLSVTNNTTKVLVRVGVNNTVVTRVRLRLSSVVRIEVAIGKNGELQEQGRLPPSLSTTSVALLVGPLDLAEVLEGVRVAALGSSFGDWCLTDSVNGDTLFDEEVFHFILAAILLGCVSEHVNS